MSTYKMHQLPDYVNHSEIRWTVEDTIITLDQATGLYVAEDIEYSEDCGDWVTVETYGPAESLRMACEFELVIP